MPRNSFRKISFCKLLIFSALFGTTFEIFPQETPRTVSEEGLPLYYWKQQSFTNFGDYLSLKLLERIVGRPIRVYVKKKVDERKLLAIGSIFYFAADNDVIWGSGINGKTLLKSDYKFSKLDVRAVRGPLTRAFLKDHFNIDCPEIYGDPALLLPFFFPEFKKREEPTHEYVIIPHFSETHLFPKSEYENVVYASESWLDIIEKILDSKLVISSTLHGIIVAEAFGIPARLLRVTENEKIFKFQDYYHGTGRPHFEFAASVDEAVQMGGEPPFSCDLEKLYEAFPFDLWPSVHFTKPNFYKGIIYENTDFSIQ